MFTDEEAKTVAEQLKDSMDGMGTSSPSDIADKPSGLVAALLTLK